MPLVETAPTRPPYPPLAVSTVVQAHIFGEGCLTDAASGLMTQSPNRPQILDHGSSLAIARQVALHTWRISTT
jgi:hypothetical protein